MADEDKKKKKKDAPTTDSFESLGSHVSKGVLDYVKAQKFTRMTPVQAATIPMFLSHKDVAVQAVTGSGKTLAFLIPIVEILRKKTFKKQQIGALVLSPTRELAQQTFVVATELCKHCGMNPPLLLVGGGSGSGSGSGGTYRPVLQDLERFQAASSDIVIGTPGRVEDVLTKYLVMDCTDLECLVLDEADVLLNMGFAQTLEKILSKLPKMRRTGLFSATTASNDSNLQEFIHRAGLRNPVWIDVAVAAAAAKSLEKKGGDKSPSSKQQATPTSLSNFYIVMPLDQKLSRLAAFLRDHKADKVIVFFLTCACVEFFGTALKQILPENSIELLHGKLVQKRREKAMERFRTCGTALFCTDVAARGLDVADVHWVVQFDAPQDPSFYVHRVGRSARAGRQGASLLFLTPKEEAYVELLQNRKIPLSPLAHSESCCPPPDDEEEVETKSKAKRGPSKMDDHGKRLVYNAKGELLEDMLPLLREISLSDRDVLEKGTKAYTSYIRAYKEHHCAFIFRFASLNLGLLATSFSLLRLPKMPELREAIQKHKGRLPHFTSAGPEVDIFAIAFKDKARETARQKRLQQEMAAGGKNAKLIKAERRQAEKEAKAKERRQEAIAKGRNPDKKRGRNARIVDEWEELAKEERLYKKLRKKKISQEEYDDLVSKI